MDLKTDNLKDIDSNEFIKEHIPFIIKTINEITGRYICLDNDEEISIGLLAFNEARQKYDYSKGHFLPYAKLVIDRKSTRLNSSHANISYAVLCLKKKSYIIPM